MDNDGEREREEVCDVGGEGESDGISSSSIQNRVNIWIYGFVPGLLFFYDIDAILISSSTIVNLYIDPTRELVMESCSLLLLYYYITNINNKTTKILGLDIASDK